MPAGADALDASAGRRRAQQRQRVERAAGSRCRMQCGGCRAHCGVAHVADTRLAHHVAHGQAGRQSSLCVVVALPARPHTQTWRLPGRLAYRGDHATVVELVTACRARRNVDALVAAAAARGAPHDRPRARQPTFDGSHADGGGLGDSSRMRAAWP